MAGRTVEYIFQLIDRFSPNASAMSRAAQSATQSINTMGEAFVQMEQRVSKAVVNGHAAATQHLDDMRAQYTKYREFQHRAMSAVNSAFSGIATFGLGQSAFREIDQFIGTAAQLQTLKAKLHQAGVTADEISSAEKKSFQLSYKHKNMSAAEIMELINDARTNLTGSFDDILDSIEPLVKLGGFMKAYDGGKHAGSHKNLLQELNRAMQSGELLGKVSPEELSKHVEMLGVMKVAFGDKFNAGQYLTAIRNSNGALLGTSDQFKYAIFPALLQSMGPAAAVGLATLAQKQAGIMVRASSANLAADLGLLDPGSIIRNKQGRVSPTGLKWANSEQYYSNPTEWIFNTLLPKIAPKVKGLDAQKFLQAWNARDQKGLEHQIKDINLGDLRRVLGQLFYDRRAAGIILENIVQAPKTSKDIGQVEKVLRSLGKYESYDKAKQSFHAQFENLVLKLGGPWVDFAISRLNNLAAVLSKLNHLVDRFPKTAHFLSGSLIAGLGLGATALFLGFLYMGIRTLSALLGANSLVRYGAGLAGGVAAGVGSAGVAGVAGVAAAASRMTLLGAAARGAALAVRFLWSTLKWGAIISVGSSGIEYLASHWEGFAKRMEAIGQRIKAVFASLVSSEQGATGKALSALSQEANSAFERMGEHAKNSEWGKGVAWLGANSLAGMAGGLAAGAGSAGVAGVAGIRQWLDSLGPPDIGADGRLVPVHPDRMRPWAMMDIPAGEARREIAVRTQVDVTPQVPLTGSVTVTVQGTVNGQVNGSGEAPITGGLQVKSDAPRGETSPANQ